MKPEQLEAIRKRSSATSGNWLAEYLKLQSAQIVLTDDVPALIDEVERLREALKLVESWTRNPREYEPSYYSINHVARVALGGESE